MTSTASTCSASYVVRLFSVTQYIAATHALPTLKMHLRHESALPLAAKLQAETASILLLQFQKDIREEKQVTSSFYFYGLRDDETFGHKHIAGICAKFS